jgi:hypothetical protein
MGLGQILAIFSIEWKAVLPFVIDQLLVWFGLVRFGSNMGSTNLLSNESDAFVWASLGPRFVMVASSARAPV